MNKVAVLMSTYNGEDYLEEQVLSILNQNTPLDLHIRDDGSSDSTVDFLHKLKEKYPDSIYIYTGDNFGPALSFLDILKTVSGYKFYAFSDQDDFWLEDKISKAIEKINDTMPFLYCSPVLISDEKLNVIGKSMPVKIIEERNILVENSIAGCTFVLNDKLRCEVLKTLPYISSVNIPMHDSWITKVAVLVGNIYFDDNSYIYYRQHQNNVVGAKYGFREIVERKVKYTLSQYRGFSKIDESIALLKIFDSEISSDKKDALLDVLDLDSNFLVRANIIIKRKLFKRGLLNHLQFVFMVLFKLYRRHV